jgi:cobalt-zinc-cadmium resistance protein CzcA
MIAALVRFSLIQRLMTILVTVSLVIGGLWAYKTLPIDAFPDISSPQVQIIVKAPGMSPSEVEQRITFPIEIEMQGLPNQRVLRSLTKYALSIITIDFADGTDIYWARQQVSERLNQVWSELPAGVDGGIAPITTPLGEIYMYRIAGEGYSNQELRTIQDWTISPRLRTVEGVAEVNSLGGKIHAFEVVPDPKKLLQYGLSLDDIEESLINNNRNAGGDRINRESNMLLVRTIGNLHKIDDINNVTIALRNGIPIHIYDVAKVRISSLTRHGGVTWSGKGEVVTGLILLRKGANSRAAVEASKKEIESLKSVLPKGVSILPFYDRSELIEDAVSTVETALIGAVILVLLVLLIMLGNLRSALTVAMILPLSVLSTFILMKIFGVSANLMSLGGLAIAIGILVDAAVVVVENIHSRLQQNAAGVSSMHIIYRAVLEVATPVISGVLIIIVVFLPLFSLTGLEGKLFTPLATTISFALISSLILSLTVIPVIATFLMSKKKSNSECEDDDGRVLKILKNAYIPIMLWALRKRKIATIISLISLLFAVMLFPFIGREFMPVMDEGTTVVIIEKTPSISLEESLKIDAVYQSAMMELPEVVGVMSRTGADELRLDPMGLYQTDNFLITKPRSEWKISLTEFQDNVRKKLEQFPNIDIAFTQPIDMRVSEMLTGVRATMAIKLYGDDLKIMEQKSEEIAKLVSNIEGAVDVVSNPVFGQLYLQIDINQKNISRYGIRVEDINKIVETAVGGRIVTKIIENNRPIPVILRYPQDRRNSFENIAALLVEAPSGAKVSLGKLATIKEVDGPVQITREAAKRQVVIQANVKDRDVVSFVNEIQRDIKQKISLPSGYYVTFGGQFENQQRASTRLTIILPVSIILIFIILFMTFHSLRQALLIILNIPFALIGGIVALYISGLYLSVPASIGFIILFGVAILNGVVMVSYFNQLRAAGRPIMQAVEEGAARRLRPVLMTAISTGLGLAPLLMSTGPGSELQRPLAVVVIGGLFTSMLLTLILLPTLYAWMENLDIKKTNKK